MPARLTGHAAIAQLIAEILATADGRGTAEIMRRSGKPKPGSFGPDGRFHADGVAGPLRHKTQKPDKQRSHPTQ